MENKQTLIICPNCGAEIDVNDIVYHQLEQELKHQFALKEAEMKSAIELQSKELQQRMQDIESKENDLAQKIADGIKLGVNKEKGLLQQNIRKELQEEVDEKVKTLEKELNEKSAKVKELNKVQAEIEQLKREKEEMKDAITAEAQRFITATLAQEKEKIRKAEEEKNVFKIQDKDHIINQLKTQLAEAQRKAEQGSNQIQGEVQELAIEEWLIQSFPLDTIEEIKKGQLGGDCIQTVNTRFRNECGKIYYESKRTKDFSLRWVEKFKADMIAKGADMGVIVTEAMPKDMDR